MVRLRKRWNGCSVVKPMPASTCWQCAATVRAVRPATAFASAAVSEFGSSLAASQGRLERLHRHQRVREAVAHGLEPRDRTTELHPLQRVGAREAEHGAAGAGDLVRDRAPAEGDRRLPRGGVEARRRPPRRPARGPRESRRRDRSRAPRAPPQPPSERVTTTGSDAVPHTTSISPAVAARAVARPLRAEPPAVERFPADPTRAKRGSRTARSARGFAPSADAITSSSAVAVAFVAPSAPNTMSIASDGSASSISQPSELREDAVDRFAPVGAARSRRARSPPSAARSAASIIRRSRARGAGAR